jgi:hypothetical protein
MMSLDGSENQWKPFNYEADTSVIVGFILQPDQYAARIHARAHGEDQIKSKVKFTYKRKAHYIGTKLISLHGVVRFVFALNNM